MFQPGLVGCSTGNLRKTPEYIVVNKWQMRIRSSLIKAGMKSKSYKEGELQRREQGPQSQVSPGKDRVSTASLGASGSDFTEEAEQFSQTRGGEI